MYGYIYETTNLINGKKYIGQKKSNIFLEEGYLGSGRFIQVAINKYGKENFKVRLIEECDTKYQLDEREIYWIDYYNAVKSKSYYNISKGGEHWNLSSEYIAETNRKYQSKKMTGRICIHKGYNKEKLIWPIQLDYYLNTGWSKGRCLRSREIASEISKNQKCSEETRKKISKSLKGRKKSAETKMKMSAYWKGKSRLSSRLPKSEKTKQKMSESAKIRNLNNTIAKGRIWIYKDETRKMIYPTELQHYIDLGFIKGTPESFHNKCKSRANNHGFISESRVKDKIYISLNNEVKLICPSELEYYESLGWTRGNIHLCNKRKPCSDSTKLKLSNVFKNTRWMNNGINSKQIKSNLVDQYLLDGWSFGRLEKGGKNVIKNSKHN